MIRTGEDRLVIEQRQCMQRCIGTDRSDLTRASFRCVKERGRRNRSSPEGIDASTKQIIADAFLIVETSHARIGPGSWWLGRKNRRATKSRAQQLTVGEDNIANHPAWKSIARCSGKPAIFRILLFQLRRPIRGLPIGGAHRDQLVDMFDVPATLHELDGQPVE